LTDIYYIYYRYSQEIRQSNSRKARHEQRRQKEIPGFLVPQGPGRSVSTWEGRDFSFLRGGEVMNQVPFKTLDTATVHRKLINVGERIAVVSAAIDKWNDCVHCAVLPILRDADYELGEVFNDLKLNGQEELSKEELDELMKKYRLEYKERLEENLAKVKAEIEADEKEAPTG
jgi:hypothetical protein